MFEKMDHNDKVLQYDKHFQNRKLDLKKLDKYLHLFPKGWYTLTC